jgi:hypothetical protein
MCSWGGTTRQLPRVNPALPGRCLAWPRRGGGGVAGARARALSGGGSCRRRQGRPRAWRRQSPASVHSARVYFGGGAWRGPGGGRARGADGGRGGSGDEFASGGDHSRCPPVAPPRRRAIWGTPSTFRATHCQSPVQVGRDCALPSGVLTAEAPRGPIWGPSSGRGPGDTGLKALNDRFLPSSQTRRPVHAAMKKIFAVALLLAGARWRPRPRGPREGSAGIAGPRRKPGGARGGAGGAAQRGSAGRGAAGLPTDG